jgi:hypothetical protein
MGGPKQRLRAVSQLLLTCCLMMLPPANAALQFDGNDDGVVMGNVLGQNRFTITAWCKRQGPGRIAVTGPGGVEAEPLVTKGRREGEGTTLDLNYFLGIDPVSGRLAADFEEGPGTALPGTNHPLYGATEIEDGLWYHCAITYDGTTFRIYLNGRLETAILLAVPARADSLQHFSIGTAVNSLGEAKGAFNGIIEQVTIWSVSLEPDAIRGLMWNAPTGSEGDLAAFWPLDESSGTIAEDRIGAFDGELQNFADNAWVESDRKRTDWIAPPVQLRAWPSTTGGIHLNWEDRAENEIGYEIERRRSDNADWLVTASLAANETTLTDTEVEGGAEYYFRVRAVGSAASNQARATAQQSGEPVEIKFRNGLNTYDGTIDLGIRQTVPPGPNGTWNHDHLFTDNYGPDNQDQALIQFPGIIGDEKGFIPAGATIILARLRLWVGGGADSTTDTVRLNRLLLPWDNTATWNSFDNGIATDDIEAAAAADDEKSGIPGNEFWSEWDITETMQSWVNGGPNYGWVILNLGGDGFGFWTSRSRDLGIRPELVITYQFGVPQSPTDLIATPLSESSIELSWLDRSDNETAFTVERRSKTDGDWVVIASDLPSDTRQYIDQGPAAATRYDYRVTALNEHGSRSSESARATTDDGPFGNRTVAFQNGINGYAGTRSVGIIQTDPATSSLDSSVWIENPNDTNERQALLSFNGVFGDGPNQVPEGATVTSARLRIYLGDRAGSESRRPIFFHRMLVPWSESSTWASSTWGGNGVDPDGTDAEPEEDAWLVFSIPGLFFELDVVDSIQAWANGAPAHGWVIRSERNDDYAFTTSHHADPEFRPELIVQYDTDPTNGFPVADAIHSPFDGATNLPGTASIDVTVSDPDGDLVTVTLYGRRLPVVSDDFTVVILPDTQFYSGRLHGGNEQMFISQTDWVVANRESLNIAFVLHAGDVTQNADRVGGQSNESEWLRATEAMYRLEDHEATGLTEGVPYTVTVGNHDQEGGENGATLFFNKYFGVDHFEGRSYYGGHHGNDNDNHYELFQVGPYRFLSISLEYRTTPEAGVLEWADNLLKQYPDHDGLITTHHLVNPGIPAPWSPYGAVIYDVLKDNPNLRMMFGGHITGEGIRFDTYEGRTITSMVQNYQAWPEGGNGYLRILTFRPQKNEVQVRTYSPWLDDLITDPASVFSIPYDLTLPIPSFEVIAEDTVASGSRFIRDWPDLNPGHDYEWRLSLSDGRKYTETSEFRFSTKHPYEDWIAEQFSGGNGETARTDDPDRDGMANLLEFLFDGDPLDPNLDQGFPTIVVGPGTTRIRYQRRNNAALFWYYEVSTDLTRWERPGGSTVIQDEQVDDNGDGTETVTIDITNSGSTVFWRMQVE